MPNGEQHTPPTTPVTQRDLWQQIEALRTETREARHTHANNTQRAINDLSTRIDERLRSIERVIDQSAPTTMGPRLNELEMWRARADADEPRGLPGRVAAIEEREDRRDGVIRAFAILATIAGFISTIVGILSVAQGGS